MRLPETNRQPFFISGGLFWKTLFFTVSLQRYFMRMNRLLITATTLLLNLLIMQAQQRFTVVIDPGHGGRDPGAVSVAIYEKTINLAVALQLGALIEQNHKDVKVLYTRKTDVFIPLDERANIANRNNADMFISIHTNSVKKTNVSGTETYTLGLASTEENLEVAMRENSVISMEDDYILKYEGFDPSSTESYIMFELAQSNHLERSVSLASEIQREFARINRGNRGVRQAGFLVLRKTSMPSVLIELGFLSNRAEQQYMASRNGQRNLAQSIFQAFTIYKSDYDRKSGVLTGKTVETINRSDNQVAMNKETNDPPPIVNRTAVTTTMPPPARLDEIIYKVQILTSDKQLALNDKRLKGYKDVSFYIEKGIYKYTYGATSNYNEVLNMQKKAVKDFRDAFIIRTKNNIRIY